MSEMLIKKATLTGIADAIRGKEGSSATIPVTALAQRITDLPSGGASLPTLSDPAGENDVRWGKDYIDENGLQNWGQLHMDTVLTPDWSEHIPISVQYDSDDRYLVMDRLPTASGGGSAEAVSATIYIYAGEGVTITYMSANGIQTTENASGEISIDVIKNSPITIAYSKYDGTYLTNHGGSGYMVHYDNFSVVSGAGCEVISFYEDGSVTYEEA